MAIIKEEVMSNITKFYIKDDFTLIKLILDNKMYKYYENDCLIKEGYTKKIKDFSLPIEPILNYNHLILCDYYKGIEIIGETHVFLPITSVYDFYCYRNILVFIRQKLVTIYDLHTHQVIEEFNCNAEICTVEKCRHFLLFYKKCRGISYIYDMKNCTWLQLGKFEMDGLLMKISIEEDLLYIFASNELVIYDIKSKNVINRIKIKLKNTDIRYYSSPLDIIPNKGIDLKEEPTTNDIYSYLFHKFGIITFIMFTDIKLINNYYGAYVADKINLLAKAMSFHINRISTSAELQKVKDLIEQMSLDLKELI